MTYVVDDIMEIQAENLLNALVAAIIEIARRIDVTRTVLFQKLALK